MKLTGRDIKDKRIFKAGLAFVAEVEFSNGNVTGAGRHLTLVSAQKALAKYPPDVFEGNDDPTKTKRLDKKRQLNLKPYQRPRRKEQGEYIRLYDRRPL